MSAGSQPAVMARELGTPGATLLGLGSILGTGVFVSLALAAGGAGDLLLLAILVAGGVALCNATSSAALAAAHPVSGGTYEYGYRLLHPAVGFSAGTLFLLAKGASAATAALGAAAYALHLVGASSAALTPLAAGITVVLTLLAASGLRRSNAVNAIIVLITTGSLLTLAVVLFAASPASPTSDVGRRAARELSPDAWRFLEACALVFVAFTGYGRIATMGEEIRDPKRNIPRAILATLGVTTALYLLIAAAALHAVGPARFAAALEGSGAPLESLAEAFGGPVLQGIVAVGAVTAMLGVLLNLLLGLSRVVLAMARRGDLPRGLAGLSGDGGNPRAAVLFVGGAITAGTLIGDFALTWSFSALTVLGYYGLTNLAALRLDASDARYPRALAVLGLIGCFGLAPMVGPRMLAVGGAALGAALLLRALLRREKTP